jgi:transcriptional regulator with XRE-family HTH domain
MDDPLEQPEMARRIRAAMHYGRITIKRAAELTNISPDHFARYTSGRTRYVLSHRQLRALAAEAGIDPNFFTADLDRLEEIVPPGGTIFKRLEAQAPPAPPAELRRPPGGPEPSGGTDPHEPPGPGRGAL